MKAICIKGDDIAGGLTVGKTYEVEFRNDLVYLADDAGVPRMRSKEDFKEVVRPQPDAVTSSTAPGIKHDGEKPDMSLLSATWVMGVARVLTFGKQKYAAHNWRKGLAVSRLIAASLRHIFQFLSGEDKDPETGESHLYHASCCLMFAAETIELRPQFDDRWRPDARPQASNNSSDT